MPDALADRSRELLTFEARRDREDAEKWFRDYDQMPSTLRARIEKTGDVPVDIEPIFSHPDVPH